MAKKKVVLSFPPTLIEEPVTYRLVKDFDLMVNILRATVKPREKGRMVVEMEGSADHISQALEYLEGQGVLVDPLVQEMRHHTDKCVNCTACSAVCPTGAIAVDRQTMEISFQHELCIICEACIPTCSYGALQSQF